MKKVEPKLFLAFLLIIGLLVAGCAGTGGSEQPATVPEDGGESVSQVGGVSGPQVVRPPVQKTQPEDKEPAPDTPVAAPAGKKVTFRIYGVTPDLMYQVPLTVEAAHPEDMPQQALKLLFAWPDESGATVSPWPGGVKLCSLKIKDGTALVDLTGFDAGSFGSSREALALDSLTLTLTQFDHIQRVQVLLDGQVVESLAGHVDISRPLTPPEHLNHFSFGAASSSEPTLPLTLYFPEPNAMYLVPVTRDVPKTQSVARAVVEELIRGPEENSGLGRSIPEGTRLLGIKLKDGLLTVDFSPEISKNHWGGTAGEAITLGSIVHSLTALPGVDRVEILIAGQRGASIAGHVVLDQPSSGGELNLLPQF